MNDAVKTLLISATSALMGVFMMASYQAIAEGDSPINPVVHQIPYQGYLELDGQPIHAVGNDALQMTFTLYQGDGNEAPSIHQETQTVQVFAGRFTALLNVDTLEEIASGDVYLGITLAQEDGPIALANRQRFLPVPMAVAAPQFVIGQELHVRGNTYLDGAVTLHNALNVQSNATVQNDLVVQDSLVIQDNATVQNNLEIQDNLVVQDNATVRNNLQVRNDLEVLDSATIRGRFKVDDNAPWDGRSGGDTRESMPGWFEPSTIACPISNGTRGVMVGAALERGGGDLTIRIFCTSP